MLFKHRHIPVTNKPWLSVWVWSGREVLLIARSRILAIHHWPETSPQTVRAVYTLHLGGSLSRRASGRCLGWRTKRAGLSQRPTRLQLASFAHIWPSEHVPTDRHPLEGVQARRLEAEYALRQSSRPRGRRRPGQDGPAGAGCSAAATRPISTTSVPSSHRARLFSNVTATPAPQGVSARHSRTVLLGLPGHRSSAGSRMRESGQTRVPHRCVEGGQAAWLLGKGKG